MKDDMGIQAKPLVSQNRDRSEQDHKQLVTDANKGVSAIRELKKHYGDMTIVNNGGFSGETLDTFEDADLDISFGIKE
jgi:hypothetical protein